MLEKIRKLSSSKLAIVLMVLFIIPFALFFGMESYMQQRVETYAARISQPPAWWPSAPSYWPVSMLWQHEEIDAEEFRNAFERERQQQRQVQGDAFDTDEFRKPENKRRVLEQMIDQRLLRMLAEDAGIVVGDAQVRAMIQSIPAFQVDGKFNPQQYQLTLASQVPARSPRQFEQLVREDLQQSLIPSQIIETAFATPSEVDRLLRLLGERRDVAFAVMPAPAPDTGAVGAAEIQRWYDSHAAAYRAPETVTLEYVDIDGSRLPPPPAADEAALRQRYEQEQARYTQAEERLASHILVEVPAGADAAAQQAAQARAGKIAAQAKQPGADFAALARTESDDAGSKAAGGDLGWVGKEMMAKPFEEALFAMQPGEVVGPVKTEFGWHVIQLREVKAGSRVPFEQVREQLAAEQLEADRERQFNALTGKLVDQVYKNPMTLAPAARAANLPVQRIGPLARGRGEGLAANPAVQRAAFSEALIQDGTVSDPIELGPMHSVLIRVVAHTPERALPLAQVSAQVVAAIRADRAARAAARQADAMVAAVRDGKPLAEVAAARQLATSDVPGLPRGTPVPDAAAAEAMFAAPAPMPGKVSSGKAVLEDSRIVVFAVSKVIPGDPAEATAAQRAALQQQLAQVAGNDDVRALVKALRQRVKVRVVESQL